MTDILDEINLATTRTPDNPAPDLLLVKAKEEIIRLRADNERAWQTTYAIRCRAEAAEAERDRLLGELQGIANTAPHGA